MHGKLLESSRIEVISLIRQQVEDVFGNLLQSTDLLRSEKQDQQQRTLSSENIEQWKEILNSEIYKVDRLEVAFAVVGTMKSGKSTTINAIVGTEVLPNRNQPMTTLPTVIRHCPGKIQPELKFSNPEPFNQLIAELKDVIAVKQKDGTLEQMAFCSTDDGKELVAKIANGSISSVGTHYKGQEEIFAFLKCINDIWRLCGTEEITIDIARYLDQYDEIQKFPEIEIEFSHLREQGMEPGSGSFALIDTPGPNESGQRFLRQVMQEQLEKASAVLAVLDYTQLNAEADAEIRRSLEEVSGVTDSRLFVFVNKFDQKDRHGMDSETLRSYVVKQLLEGRLEKEHVYPVSSKYGYLANRALNEIHFRGQLPDYRFNPWVEDFGRLALGACWESEIEDVAEVKSRAVKLWRSSQFDVPLTEVIKKGYENAAVMSLLAAIAKMDDYDRRIIEGMQFRQNALHVDIDVIENNIRLLEKDIVRLNDARNDAETIIRECTKNLQRKIFGLFDNIDGAVKKEIQVIFNRKKNDDWISKRLTGYIAAPSDSIEFDPQGFNDFSAEDEARHFLEKLIEVASKHIEPVLVEMHQSIKTAVDEMSEAIWISVNGRLEPVLKSAEERLHDAFSVVMDFPKPGIRSFSVDFAQLRQSSIREDSITKVGTKQERRWYTLWCRDHEIPFEYAEQVYRIYTQDIIEQLQSLMEADSNEIWTSLNKYVRSEFSPAINSYFSEIANYLERFRGDLVDAKRDKEMESEALENLTVSMNGIIQVAAEHRNRVQALEKSLPHEKSAKISKIAG